MIKYIKDVAGRLAIVSIIPYTILVVVAEILIMIFITSWLWFLTGINANKVFTEYIDNCNFTNFMCNILRDKTKGRL